MDKDKQNDELLELIRKELTAILVEEESGDPARKVPFERMLKKETLPSLEPSKAAKQKKSSSSLDKGRKMSPSYRQALSGKSIKMKPSSERLSGGQDQSPSATSVRSSPSKLSDSWDPSPTERSLRVEFMESQAAKSIDEDLQKMQLELKQSYELFQGIAEKFESINFGGLKNRIRDLHLSSMSNEMGKVTTMELHKMFENRFVQNRLDKLTTDVSTGFRRHPGEFGDIPELSTFFQACTQLEHGLDALKQQRRRSSDLEKRMCWATEIAYDRMDEIRNAVGPKPETNF